MKNWLLSLVTLLLVYALLEIFCLVIFFRTLSHGAYPFLDEGVSFALQTTKRNVMPEDYLAIVGDSYAMGLGDQYYLGNAQQGAEYGSAPFLHKALQQDVISFGTAGNSSISGMVTQPILAIKFFNKSWRTTIQPPQKILVYFYEGNDFSDNVEYFHYTRKRVKFQKEKMNDQAYFSQYIQEAALETHPWNKSIEEMRWYDQLYLAKFVGKVCVMAATHLLGLLDNTHKLSSTEIATTDSPLNMRGRFGWKSPGTINQVLVKGMTTQIPDKVQGPSSIVLSEEEKTLSLLSYGEALRYLKKSFPAASVTVVYLPSVISSYEITSPQVFIQHFRKGEGGLYSADQVRQQSDWGAEQIRRLTEEQQVYFIDARPEIRQASKTQLLHGTNDWNHFNEAGYRALSEAVLHQLHSQ